MQERERKNCLARLCYNSYLYSVRTDRIRVAIDMRQICQKLEMSVIPYCRRRCILPPISSLLSDESFMKHAPPVAVRWQYRH